VPTNIVFLSGQELSVAEAVDDVVAAARASAQPVVLESTIGARVLVNWDHVAYAAEAPPVGPGVPPSGRRARPHAF
jgi:hypothetical protein